MIMQKSGRECVRAVITHEQILVSKGAKNCTCYRCCSQVWLHYLENNYIRCWHAISNMDDIGIEERFLPTRFIWRNGCCTTTRLPRLFCWTRNLHEIIMWLAVSTVDWQAKILKRVSGYQWESYVEWKRLKYYVVCYHGILKFTDPQFNNAVFFFTPTNNTQEGN